MIAACRNQIRGISTKGTVPDPSLMAIQTSLQGESSLFSGFGEVLITFDVVRGRGVNTPDPSIMIGAASSEMPDVG